MLLTGTELVGLRLAIVASDTSSISADGPVTEFACPGMLAQLALAAARAITDATITSLLIRCSFEASH